MDCLGEDGSELSAGGAQGPDVARSGAAQPVAEARRGACAKRPRAQPREEAAQGVQVGSVHRAEHECTVAGGAALPFEAGENPRSRKSQDRDVLVRPYQADLRVLDGDGRV
jgi:hypothetical protein